jgi:glutathione S-transferase
MLQLLGRENSSNVQTVLIALHEMGLPFERHDFGGPFGKTQTEDYLRRNPMALVPTLMDGELSVWESNTILRYLAHKYGPTPLYPDDPAARSYVERWMDWRQTAYGLSIGPVFLGYIRTTPEKRDMVMMHANEKKCGDYLKLLDAQLAGRAFITGETFTMADITLVIFVNRYYVMPIETPRPALPNVERWRAAVCARPSVKRYAEMKLT